ncbi:hypothetical protein Hanom_Chr12g01108031 [Helianthus anomalus]
MFVHLTNRTKFLVHVRYEHKRTSRRTVHELFTKRSVRLQPYFYLIVIWLNLQPKSKRMVNLTKE